MAFLRVFVIGLAAMVLSGCLGELPVVGIDRDGRIIDKTLRSGEYVSRMTSTLGDMKETVIPVLDSEETRQQMMLREAKLGLHLKGDVGLGDYFKLAGTIGFRLAFANK